MPWTDTDLMRDTSIFAMSLTTWPLSMGLCSCSHFWVSGAGEADTTFQGPPVRAGWLVGGASEQVLSVPVIWKMYHSYHCILVKHIYRPFIYKKGSEAKFVLFYLLP